MSGSVKYGTLCGPSFRYCARLLPLSDILNCTEKVTVETLVTSGKVVTVVKLLTVLTLVTVVTVKTVGSNTCQP